MISVSNRDALVYASHCVRQHGGLFLHLLTLGHISGKHQNAAIVSETYKTRIDLHGECSAVLAQARDLDSNRVPVEHGLHVAEDSLGLLVYSQFRNIEVEQFIDRITCRLGSCAICCHDTSGLAAFGVQNHDGVSSGFEEGFKAL